VERLLDNLPTIRHPKEREKIRHTNPGASQRPRPVCDLKPNNSDRFEYIYAYNAGFNVRGRPISGNPIEQKLRSDSKLITGIPKKRSLGMEGRTHHFAVSLFAAINVKLQCFQDLVLLRLRLRLYHIENVRLTYLPLQWTSTVKEGGPSCGHNLVADEEGEPLPNYKHDAVSGAFGSLRRWSEIRHWRFARNPPGHWERAQISEMGIIGSQLDLTSVWPRHRAERRVPLSSLPGALV